MVASGGSRPLDAAGALRPLLLRTAASALLLTLPTLLGLAEGSDTCPAGDASCGVVATPKCVKWRQTGGCTPHGPRENDGDKPCSEDIPIGRSGYCQCGSGESKRKVRMSTCDHRPFKCETECLQYLRYTCLGWRQTADCDADGRREDQQDKSCDEEIDPRWSGFCECGDGRIVRKPGCEHGEYEEKFTCRNVCEAEPDLYEDLGVDSGVDDKAIKQAFRKLSLKYHPDKTRGSLALKTRFEQIREAYDIIGDAEQRGLYDSNGLQMVYESRGKGKVDKGPAMNGEVQVTLEWMYNGHELTTSVKRKVICRGCADRNSPRCHKCNAGCANEVQLVNVQMGPMIMQQHQEVPSKQKCRWENTQLLVTIERGMSNGDTTTFKAQGEHQPKKRPGDVILKLVEAKHPTFKRVGVDLHAEVAISLKEALLGWERTLTHLDGRKIVIGFDGVTEPFGLMRIAGEGMPHKGDPTQSGSLIVKCKILMPDVDKIDDTKRRWLEDNFPV